MKVKKLTILKKLTLTSLLTLFCACSHSPSLSRGPASPLEVSNPNEWVAHDRIPNVQSFLGWQNKGYQSSAIDPRNVQRISVSCHNSDLYPTHPQQTLKSYHVFLVGHYNPSQLKSGDAGCGIGATSANSQRVRACLSSDRIEFAIISDTYMDACGHSYRGFWDVLFLGHEENMGTLFSKGRTMYRDTHSQFANDMYVAQTYPLAAGDFLFLSPLFPGDAEKIEQNRQSARETHHFDEQKHVFEPIQSGSR